MYSVSTAYSEAIAKQSRHFRLTGSILLQSRASIDITDRNILGDFLIESLMMSGSSSEDIIDIGAVVSSRLTMTIHDSSSSDSFADALVRPIVGLQTSEDVYEDIPMGIFYVNSASIKRIKDQISFIAYDKMILMNYILTEDMRSAISQMKPYGATAYLAAFVGIPMAQEQAVVDAFPNGDIILSGATDKRIETARDLLMWCAQMMGCFVRVDRSGCLEYVQIKAENDSDTGMIIPVREIAASQRTDTRFADGVLRISSLIMKKADGIHTRAYLAETSSTKRSVELELEQNPLLLNQETRSVGEALKAILTVLKTAYFRPFTASIANDPALDAGDYVRLRGGNIDTSRGYATGMITHSTWRYSGMQEIVNVGAVPVIGQLENEASAAAEIAEVSEVEEEESSGDVSGNDIVYTQPRRQSDKLMESSGSGSVASAEKLQTASDALIVQTTENEMQIVKPYSGQSDQRVAGIIYDDSTNYAAIRFDPHGDIYGASANTSEIRVLKTSIDVVCSNIVSSTGGSAARCATHLAIGNGDIGADFYYQKGDIYESQQFNIAPETASDTGIYGIRITAMGQALSFRADGIYINDKKILTEE